MVLLFGELLTRLELVTSSLPRKCSTTELQQQLFLFRVVQKYARKLKRPKKCAIFSEYFLSLLDFTTETP